MTCDAFMAELIHRARLDVWFPCEIFTGRRGDVERLRGRLEGLTAQAMKPAHPPQAA